MAKSTAPPDVFGLHRRSATFADRLHLSRRRARRKSLRREHFGMFLIGRPQCRQGFLLAAGEVEEDPQHQILAELQILAGADGGVSIGGDRPLLQCRGATAGLAFDAMLDHEVQPARSGTDHGLPALHRTVDRPRNQCQLLQLVAAIWHLRG
jgi:hypothetical protein